MGKQVWALGAVCVLLLAFAAYVAYNASDRPPRFGSPSSSRSMASSLSSVKQISLALLLYEADYDDRMPPRMDDPASIEFVLDPYMKNRSLWASTNPNGSRFVTNGGLSFVPATGLLEPPKTIAVYDSLDWPNGRRPVSYADGHAKIVTAFDPSKDLLFGLTEKARQEVEGSKADASASATVKQKSERPLGMP